jgi:hypothetical protein
MKKSTALVLLTVAGFVVGLGTGLWIGLNTTTPPPPPAWLFSEFRNVSTPGTTLQNLVQSRPELWSEIHAELQTLKPQIDAYRAKLEKIDGDFRADLEVLLTEEQKIRFAEAQKKRELPRLMSAPAPQTKAPAASVATTPPPAAPSPKLAEAPKPKIERAPRTLQESSDGLVSSMVFVPYTQERFTQVLGLSEAQEDRLRQLLITRRERFLQISDEVPPPSLQLSRIADIIKRVAAEPAKAP